MKLRRIKIGRDCALGTLLCLALSACAFGGQIVDRVVAGPILHGVRGRIRVGPIQTNRVDGFFGAEIHDDPLRVQGIALAGERLVEIRIALPIGRKVAVGQTRVVVVVALVVREAALR